MDQNKAAAAALHLAQERKRQNLCVSKDVLDRSPSMTSILNRNTTSTSSSGITSSSSKTDPQQTPEPMDTSESLATPVTEISSSSATPSVSFTDTSGSADEIGTAASSTLVLVTSSASTDNMPSPTPLHAAPASSSDGVQPSSSSEISSAYDVQPTATSSSSGMDLSTSDSVSLLSSDADLTSTTGVKFSSSTFFKAITADGMIYFYCILDPIAVFLVVNYKS